MCLQSNVTNFFVDFVFDLYFFELKDDKIVNDQLIPVKSRVRDIIYHKENNYLVMYLETNNALAIFKKVN